MKDTSKLRNKATDPETPETLTRGRQTPVECEMEGCENLIPRYGILCPDCYKLVHKVAEEAVVVVDYVSDRDQDPA